jgi:hypothetical protein
MDFVPRPYRRLSSEVTPRTADWREGRATRYNGTIWLYLKYRIVLGRRMLPVARDLENAAATLRQNQQLTTRVGKAEKSWRIFRADRRAAQLLPH